MQLLSIFTTLALGQITLAAESCTKNERYCGSEFKKFSHASNVAGLEDNTLYLCKDYKGDPGGNFGELVWVRNHPMLVQRCPVKCEVTGQGTNDHCSGESLLTTDSSLARCADRVYTKRAKDAEKATNRLQQLKVAESIWSDLYICLAGKVYTRILGSTDEKLKKEALDLGDDLWAGLNQTRHERQAEEVKEGRIPVKVLDGAGM